MSSSILKDSAGRTVLIDGYQPIADSPVPLKLPRTESAVQHPRSARTWRSSDAAAEQPAASTGQSARAAETE